MWVQLIDSDLGAFFDIQVALLPSSVIWCWPMGSDASTLQRERNLAETDGSQPSTEFIAKCRVSRGWAPLLLHS